MTFDRNEYMRRRRAEKAIALGRVPGKVGHPKRLRCNAGHSLKDNTMAWGECKKCYEIAHPNGLGRPIKKVLSE